MTNFYQVAMDADVAFVQAIKDATGGKRDRWTATYGDFMNPTVQAAFQAKIKADQAWMDYQQQTAQAGGPKCPGCGGDGVLTDDPQVLRCQWCGGIYTDPNEPITVEQASPFVRLTKPMLANAGPDGQFYFDLDVLPADKGGDRAGLLTSKFPDRYHGWADAKTKRVVQWG